MNNTAIKRNIFAIVLGLLVLPFVSSAQAPRLEVIFTPDPLFSEASVLPGDSVIGTVEVINNSGEDQTVITEAINVSDPDILSGEMTLSIVDDDTNTFFDDGDGTFHDFLTGGPLTLTNPISDGDSILYTFSVSFSAATGNEFQKTELGFDLCVGFLDELSGMNCGETTVSDEQGTGDGDGMTQVETLAVETESSGGGGGPVDLVHLKISNERVVSIDDVTGTALIAWETNLFSTSQVVYGITSGGPYSLQPLLFNFGYPQATVEDENKVISHTAVISGLTKGENYSFRVVSRASPATVSYEHRFDVEKTGTAPIGAPTPIATGPTISNSGGNAPSSNVSSGSSNTSSGSVLAVATSDSNESIESVTLEPIPSNTEGLASSTTETEDETDEERRAELEEFINGVSDESPRSDQNDDKGLAPEGFSAAAFFSGVVNNELVSCISTVALLLLTIFILDLIIYKIVQGEKYRKAKKLLWLSLLLVGAVLMLYLSKTCAFILILIILLGLIVSNLYQSRDLSKNREVRSDGIMHKKPLN